MAVIARREVENDEDYESNYRNRLLRFSMVIEKEAADVYTKEIFASFHKELLDGFSYRQKKVEEIGSMSTFHVWREEHEQAFRTVTLDSSDNSVRCSCLLFEFAGDHESPSGSKSNDMPVGKPKRRRKVSQNVNDSATTTNNQLETSMQHICSSGPTKNMHVSGGSNVKIHQSGQELTSTNGIINIDLNDPVEFATALAIPQPAVIKEVLDSNPSLTSKEAVVLITHESGPFGVIVKILA
ncbi:hypothetical protein IFM89_034149 [Coptis chinensis]|uniref:Protein FAR1-RELATED SEQUENCE n=1 Tax=Coptis chinensis TaxID=261450 RepID=A0A835HZS7_9MAGN|nr:hypothetical protein IFM89_034149 [Coptis chinensis]